MIQRIQSLYLAAIIVLSILMFFLPFQDIAMGNVHHSLSLMPGSMNGMVKSFIYVPILVNFSVMVLSLICIFLFRNRKLQMRLCMAILALSAVLISNLFTFHYIKSIPDTYTANPAIACIFPVLNVVFALLARQAIKKDEELVRSADRIR